MELIEVDCTNVDDMLKRLALFGDYWMSRSLLRILGHLWSYLWKSDSETRAVLLYGSEWMVIILNITHEHVKPTCRIEITSMFIRRDWCRRVSLHVMKLSQRDSSLTSLLLTKINLTSLLIDRAGLGSLPLRRTSLPGSCALTVVRGIGEFH